MSDLKPTYAFEGDEVYAVLDGKVIASGSDIVSVEAEAKPKIEAAQKVAADAKREKAKKTATHIETPNGVTGQILGRVASTWGEEITVRFENGEIRSFQTSGGERYYREDTQKTASASPIDSLQAVLDKSYDHTKEGLRERIVELKDVARQASQHVASGTAYEHQVKLDEIRVVAEAEAAEAQEVVDHLDAADNESFAPPQPYDLHAVEQATVGVRDDGSPWLDAAFDEMVTEAEGRDYEKFLDEEPGVFVADLPDAVIADQGAVADMALSHVTERTAAVGLADPAKTEEYRTLFVARAEQARRAEFADRQKTTKREAAVQQETESNLPDDALFI